MGAVSLLRMGDSPGERATFVWEHINAHRTFYAAMSPLARFTTMPYLLDPQPPPTPRLNDAMWRLKHQQAHDDSMVTLPTWPYSVIGRLPAEQVPDPLPLGLPTNQNLIDTDLDNPGRRNDWLFTNHNEHYVGTTVMPAVSEWVWPFW
jgi:hypothetical protein